MSPVFRRLEDLSERDIIAYIVSANVHRRDLQPGQRAMIMARIDHYHEEAAKERQRQHGGTAPGRKNTSTNAGGSVGDRRSRESAQQTAQQIGVSHNTVTKARKVQNEAPDLAEQVRQGEVTLEAAYKQATRRNEGEGRATPWR